MPNNATSRFGSGRRSAFRPVPQRERQAPPRRMPSPMREPTPSTPSTNNSGFSTNNSFTLSTRGVISRAENLQNRGNMMRAAPNISNTSQNIENIRQRMLHRAVMTARPNQLTNEILINYIRSVYGIVNNPQNQLRERMNRIRQYYAGLQG